jgi:PAS domain S-box-containing protein
MQRLPTLRQLLLLLACACVVPMAVLASALAVHEYRSERQRLEDDTIATARALMAAVDDRLDGAQRALQALASSPALAAGDFERLRQDARVVHRAEDVESLVLVDAQGRVTMSSREQDEALPEAFPSGMLGALRGPDAGVLDLFRAPGEGRQLVGVSVPLPPPFAGALHASIATASVQRLLQRQGLRPTWTAAVLDGSGTVVARTHDHAAHVGTRAPAALLARLTEVPEDTVDGTAAGGDPVVTAFSRSPRTGWSVVIGMPRDELGAPLVRSASLLLAGTLAVLLGTLWLAWRLAGRLSDSVEALGGAVRATGHRASLRLPRPAFQEAQQLGMAFAHAHAALEDAHAAQARSETRMRAILDTAADAIVTADDSGRIILFNPAAERMFLRRSEETLGEPLEVLLPPHLRARHREIRRRAAEVSGRRMAGDRLVEGLRGDGTTFQAEAAISVAEEGDGRLYTVMMREKPADSPYFPSMTSDAVRNASTAAGNPQ